MVIIGENLKNIREIEDVEFYKIEIIKNIN